MKQSVPPEEVLLRALREAPDGLTVTECRDVLRPVAGRTRLEQALAAVRDSPGVRQSIEVRPNRSQRLEKQRVLSLTSAASATPAPAATKPATPHIPDPVLIVTHGPNRGQQFVLDAERNVVGRHPTNKIFLDDETVSRRHAEVHRLGGQFTIRDAGSLNGTYVNDSRVDQTILTPGDEVDIGAFRLTFRDSAQHEP